MELYLKKASKIKHGDRIFHELGSEGLISFSEYMFLVSILKGDYVSLIFLESRSKLKLIFCMFDRDQDGKVNLKDFKKVLC